MALILLLNFGHFEGVPLPDKVQHFGLSSVGQVEKSLKSKLVDNSIE